MKFHFFVFSYFLASIVAIPKGLLDVFFFQLFFFAFGNLVRIYFFFDPFQEKKGTLFLTYSKAQSLFYLSIVAHEIRTPRLSFEKSTTKCCQVCWHNLRALYKCTFFMVASYFTLTSLLFQANVKCCNPPIFFRQIQAVILKGISARGSS